MDTDECAICCNKFDGVDVAVMDCKHTFHFSCIVKWNQQSNQCPMCRCDMTIGRNPPPIPRVPEEVEIAHLDVPRISCCVRFMDKVKTVFIWIACISVIYTILVGAWVRYLIWKRNNDYGYIMKNAILNDDFNQANSAMMHIDTDSVAYEALDDAIRFDRTKIAKLIIDKHRFDDAGKYSKALKYAEYHKNEIIISYIRNVLDQRRRWR